MPLIQHPDEGKTIRSLRFTGTDSQETIARFIATRAGQALSGSVVASDAQNLWRTSKILVRAVLVEDVEGGGVAVTFVLEEPSSYDRTVFKGLQHFTEKEVRDVLGMASAERITDSQAREHKLALEERYRADGYLYARVQIERDEESSTLTMVVDEGPEVTIRNVYFRGNRAFPGSAPLGLYLNLIGGSDLESEPAGLVSDSPYSEEAVSDDLDKLRTFYRGHGYRDAEVELAERRFVGVLAPEVDLTFRVIEGRRYRIRSVDVEYFDEGGNKIPEPLYSKEELISEFVAKPGEFYDRELVNQDKRRIEYFYGERGHPMVGRYGRAQLQRAFAWSGPAWLQPRERFDTETAEIDLVYQIIEGTPKKVRDVIIRGNTDTQDRVVRRKVFVYPGDTLDLNELRRSRQTLESLRYFQDPASPTGGVDFQLLPVEGQPDLIDVEVGVTEGDTGSFLWGAGVSTGAGLQGRFQFTKRNFDLFRGPSSWSPDTVISEIIGSKAFHGGGQSLQMSLAPGTEVSFYQVSLDEPDLFGDHIDTIGGRIEGFRRIRILDGFDTDSRGLILAMRRNFTEQFQVGIQLRQETVEVEDVEPNAPTIVWESEGQTEIRTVQLIARQRDVDHFLRPTDGYDVRATAEVAGGFLGAEEDFYKLSLHGRLYFPLFIDSWERAHVLHISQRFDFGHAYNNTDDLFLVERFYMGGSTLRGFDQRDAGPKQFGRPLGGEVRYLSRAEYQFPLVSTQQGGSIREVELLRGVLFSDMGLLGTAIDDPTFRELRLSVGIGVRIHVPILGLPIALDYGFPVLYEETDDRRGLFFSLSQ